MHSIFVALLFGLEFLQAAPAFLDLRLIAACDDDIVVRGLLNLVADTFLCPVRFGCFITRKTGLGAEAAPTCPHTFASPVFGIYE